MQLLPAPALQPERLPAAPPALFCSLLSGPGCAEKRHTSPQAAGFPEDIDEATLEGFEQMGASQVLLSDMGERCGRIWGKGRSDDADPVPQHIRQPAVRYIMACAQLMGLGPSDAQDGAALLDAYLSKATHAADRGCSIFIVCTAVVKILKDLHGSSLRTRFGELDYARPGTTGPASEIPGACDLARRLARSCGINLDCEITRAKVSAEERSVLSALEWRVNLPSAWTWASGFSKRLDVLVRQCGAPDLATLRARWAAAWDQIATHANIILLKRATSPEFSPRRVGAGLAALGLISAQLVSPESLRSKDVSALEWEHLLRQQPPSQSHRQMGTAGFLPDSFLESLPVAMGCSMERIQDDCLLVARCLRDAWSEIQMITVL